MTTGGAGGAVSSVNGQVGAVTISALPPDGAAGGVLGGTYPDPSRVAQAAVALTDASTIAVDASKGNTFSVTLGGNRTLGNPTNALDGQRIIFQVTQDGTGSRTLAYGSAYAFSSSLAAPTLSTSPGATDYLGFIYRAAVSEWEFVAFVSGFASGS